MFCPLCQAEYREGFTQCADCHLNLVDSAEEAHSSSVDIWRGEKQQTMDHVIDALGASDIPYHYEEMVNTSPHVEFAGVPVRAKHPTFEYKVNVLRRDLANAQAAIAGIKHEGEVPVCDEDEEPSSPRERPGTLTKAFSIVSSVRNAWLVILLGLLAFDLIAKLVGRLVIWLFRL